MKRKQPMIELGCEQNLSFGGSLCSTEPEAKDRKRVTDRLSVKFCIIDNIVETKVVTNII